MREPFNPHELSWVCKCACEYSGTDENQADFWATINTFVRNSDPRQDWLDDLVVEGIKDKLRQTDVFISRIEGLVAAGELDQAAERYIWLQLATPSSAADVMIRVMQRKGGSTPIAQIGLTHEQRRALVDRWNDLANKDGQMPEQLSHHLFGDNTEKEIVEKKTSSVEVPSHASFDGNPQTFSITREDVTIVITNEDMTIVITNEGMTIVEDDGARGEGIMLINRQKRLDEMAVDGLMTLRSTDVFVRLSEGKVDVGELDRAFVSLIEDIVEVGELDRDEERYIRHSLDTARKALIRAGRQKGKD